MSQSEGEGKENGAESQKQREEIQEVISQQCQIVKEGQMPIRFNKKEIIGKLGKCQL